MAPDRRLSVHDRVLAIDALEQRARDLNLMAAWLSEQGCEVEADAIDTASKNLLACCWWLSRPLNPQLPPSRWPQRTYQDGMSQPGADLR